MTNNKNLICKECKTPGHTFNCSHAEKCDTCGCRTDLPNVRHSLHCPLRVFNTFDGVGRKYSGGIRLGTRLGTMEIRANFKPLTDMLLKTLPIKGKTLNLGVSTPTSNIMTREDFMLLSEKDRKFIKEENIFTIIDDKE